MELVRAFVALQVPEEVRDRIADLQRQLGPDLGDTFRWTAREALHLTLYFLGEAPESTVAAIREGLAAVPVVQMPLTTERLTVFPGLKAPRVLVWTLLDPAQALAKLQGAVHRVCYPLAPNKESKPFKAHVTVGRLRHGSTIEPDRLKSAFDKHRPAPLSFTVGDFELVRSFLERGGPRYETLRRYA